MIQSYYVVVNSGHIVSDGDDYAATARVLYDSVATVLQSYWDKDTVDSAQCWFKIKTRKDLISEDELDMQFNSEFEISCSQTLELVCKICIELDVGLLKVNIDKGSFKSALMIQSDVKFLFPNLKLTKQLVPQDKK